MAKRHELDTAESAGGRRVGGSGSGEEKSDVVVALSTYGVVPTREECKATANRYITLKLDWLEKITQEAMATGRIPVLNIRFEGGYTHDLARKDWVVIERSYFDELRQQLR